MKTEVLKLEDINVNELPELQGWKEKQEILVKENPFIEIVDNETFKEAKKRRTALLKGRTTIQSQDKLIASKLKDFRNKVADASKSLIQITIEAEEKQQEEVKRYESVKEEERQEKIRLEEERKEKIIENINKTYYSWKSKIKEYSLDQIQDINIIEVLSDIDTDEFSEFESLWNEKSRDLVTIFKETKSNLIQAEERRLEQIRLVKEREEFEAKRKIEEEKQAKIDAENQKKQAELEAKQKELQEKENELKKIEEERLEKERIAAEKEAKIKAEKEQKEKEALAEKKRIKAEKAEKKRIESLKPDKEKLTTIINGIGINCEEPSLKNTDAKTFYSNLRLDIEDLRKNLQIKLKTL